LISRRRCRRRALPAAADDSSSDGSVFADVAFSLFTIFLMRAHDGAMRAQPELPPTRGLRCSSFLRVATPRPSAFSWPATAPFRDRHHFAINIFTRMLLPRCAIYARAHPLCYVLR